MHIAVCDDNVAERKQLERLLGRESDKRKFSTGVFYTDSFGDSVVLGKNPMPYDLFFINLTQSEPDGLSFARILRQKGVTAPIVLCVTEDDFQKTSETGLILLQKPVQVNALALVLDQALVQLENRIPTIELRSEKETYYVPEDDIVYATSSGMYVNIILKDGNRVSVLSTLSNFYSTVETYSHLVMLNRSVLVNITHVADFSSFSILLKNGIKLKSSPLASKYLKSAIQTDRSK